MDPFHQLTRDLLDSPQLGGFQGSSGLGRSRTTPSPLPSTPSDEKIRGSDLKALSSIASHCIASGERFKGQDSDDDEGDTAEEEKGNEL
ncbi:hypothetical protein CABS01_06911 [Colletotrichum abscissum]|uniref:Uncharacterized protein n=2 Tax=Colletotrichum acutatum species complex TaxID=2707335 RepID=A0A9P9X864_9PEZI|nr:uncharacterized protein CLUP02_08171 [Colletotrichum lupini]XP_060403960.1 uncharacterized protein CABS01_06911 [Colletotrichum abscissum]KAI3541562.1 hypothetical protein CABS02_10736 [Colletotrichum abscissum]KAK1514932.1 hypothetical protein CABS01_06911 [Colletotrichum abscissum]UQC82681.1 hypothetical protein CLUP02_08171 [Colletotrichum lupini]